MDRKTTHKMSKHTEYVNHTINQTDLTEHQTH